MKTKTEEKGSNEPKSTGETKEMIVPTVGESITEVTISSWLKNTGDYVELDEIIAEVDSDKATFELPAEASGILTVIAEEGDTIEIGATICKIEVTEGGAPAKEESKTSSDSAQRHSLLLKIKLMLQAMLRRLQLKFWPKKESTLNQLKALA